MTDEKINVERIRENVNGIAQKVSSVWRYLANAGLFEGDEEQSVRDGYLFLHDLKDHVSGTDYHLVGDEVRGVRDELKKTQGKEKEITIQLEGEFPMTYPFNEANRYRSYGAEMWLAGSEEAKELIGRAENLMERIYTEHLHPQEGSGSASFEVGLAVGKFLGSKRNSLRKLADSYIAKGRISKANGVLNYLSEKLFASSRYRGSPVLEQRFEAFMKGEGK